MNPKCGYSPVNLQVVAVWACKGKSLKAVELAVYQKGKWRNIASLRVEEIPRSCRFSLAVSAVSSFVPV